MAVRAVGQTVHPARVDGHILAVPLPVDIDKDRLRFADRALQKRLDDLVKRHLTARLRDGADAPDVVIFVDQSGQKVLPDLAAARARRAATGDVSLSAAVAPTELRFNFDSPFHPWTAAELTTLTTALNDLYPAAKAVYGNPAFDITVNVRKDPTLFGISGFYDATRNEIVLYNSALETLCHEMIHAFRDDNIIEVRTYEEGMTRAAEIEVFARLPEYTHRLNEHHSYTYDVYYEALSRPAMEDPWGRMLNGYVSTLLRYQLAGYAWGKALIENPAFLSTFNEALYARAVVDPGATTILSRLLEIAAAAQVAVEGVPFLTWYGQQAIFGTNPPQGYVLYQRVNQYTVDFLHWDSSGVSMQPGQPIAWGIYDYRDVLLDSGTAVTGSNGFVFSLDPTLPTGYTGRIKVVVSANTPQGVVSDSALRMVGNESGVFGVITSGASGTLTVTPLDAAIAPVTLAVTNGAFAGPSLATVRGRFRAAFTDAAGRTATRQFTKDASDYFLIVSTPAESVLPTVSIATVDSTATEAGTTPGVFTITRTGSTASPLTVVYTVSGTATPGSDYTALPGSIIIPAGMSTANVAVTPINDALMEGNQTVIATLVATRAYTIGTPRSARVTIVSDEAVSISAVDATATEAGRTTGRFRVTRTGSTVSPVTVMYSVTGTATPGSDYTALPGSVVIPAGRSAADIIVTPVNDGVMEGNETVIATLVSNAAYRIGSPRSARVTIVSDETVSISAVDATATEAGRTTATFRVTRTGSTTSPLTVAYAVSGTATPGTDYTALSGSVEILAGRSSAHIVVRPVNDVVAEGNETVIATLVPNAGYTIGARTATVTIVSDE